MNSWRLHEQIAPQTLRVTLGPEPAEGFDCGLFRPPLRANLESLDSLGILSLSKDEVRSTLSKPATKISLRLQALIHEFTEFVNYAG